VKEFDDLLAKGRRAIESVTPEDLQKLVSLGAALGRPQGVEAVVKAYFSRNPAPPPPLVRVAAGNARLAGDYRTAVTRLKQYLRAAQAGAEASESAAELYGTLLEMGERDEAFSFMKQYGEPLRQSLNARKFDDWFLRTAWEKKDFAAAARWLVLCLGSQLPLEQERLIFWDDLDRLLDETRTDRPEVYEALTPARKVVGLIRENPGRQLRLQCQLDYLALCAGAKGKEAASLEADFAPAATSARAWFDAAPTADTLARIVTLWGEGGDAQWNRAANSKREFFRQAFPRLSDADKAAFFGAFQDPGWYTRVLAAPDAWMELVRQTPDSPLRSKWAGRPDLPWNTNNPAYLKTAAAALQNVGGGSALLIRTLGASDSWWGCLQHFTQNESWQIGELAEAYGYLQNNLWNAFAQFPRDDAHKLAPGSMEQDLTRFAREVFFPSPLALMNRDITRAYLAHLWEWSGQNQGDKSRVAECLHLLDWAPLSDDDRKYVFEDVRQRYRNWSDQVRRDQQEAAKKSADEARKYDGAIALVTQIGQALKEATEITIPDPAKAPNPLCQSVTQMRLAARNRDLNAYQTAARAAYALVREYEGRKIPFGRIYFRAVVARPQGVDPLDFQVEAFADQLSLYLQQGRRGGADIALAELGANRWGQLWDSKGAERAKVEDAIGKAALGMLNAGKFDGWVFDLYRQVRNDNETSRQIMGKLIESKTLANQPGYRPEGRLMAATKYQILLDREFAWMNEKYPRDRYFDDLFAAEAVQTRLIDPEFWRWSTNAQCKAGNASAAALKDFVKLPFGYDDAKPVYGRDDFWRASWSAVACADAPTRDALLAAVESRYGTTRFDDYAMGKVSLAFAAVTNTPEARKQFFAKLAAVLDKAAAFPGRASLPPIAGQLDALGRAGVPSDEELTVLARLFRETQIGEYDLPVVSAGIGLLLDGLLAKGRTPELLALVPRFWAAARDVRDGRNLCLPLAERANRAVATNQYEVAVLHSAAAFALGGVVPDEVRKALESLRAKCLTAIGGLIPVDRGDPRYAIYAAQAAYISGQNDEAWTAYGRASGLVRTEMKNLDPAFVIWLIERATETGGYDGAEALARGMIELTESAPQSYDAETRAHLFLAYADIALARQEYPRAKAQYERIALAGEYEGTQSRRTAELRVAEVERITRDYNGAIQRLESLVRRPDRYVQTQANYQLALVKFDQEEYAAARDYLNQSLALDPALADARILEGKLYLKLKKLIEATQVKVGLTAAQRTLVPGRPLRVQIEDRNLSVVGSSMNIEVRAWASSGDEETFSLLPFGDSKIKFEGQLPTVLGEPKKGDRVLQVLGGAEVRYDFSERFKQANKLAAAEAPPVTVMSDAEVFASSGKILTKEELEELALERQIRERMRQEEAPSAIALSTVRRTDEVKPGNPIRVRVVDPDRSVTAGKDKIVLRASSSSGDTVPVFEMEETEGCSGVFEGLLPTASASATAFASDKDEGADPNFVISRGDYPPWVGLTDGKRPKSFGVDLNDDVVLGKMSVLCDVPARRPKLFAVQTSLSGRDYTTIGTWPELMPAWDGSLRMEIVRAERGRWTKLPDLRNFLQAGYLVQQTPKLDLPGVLATNFNQSVAGLADTLQLAGDPNDPRSWYVLHLRGGFYEPERITRTLRVNVRARDNQFAVFLALDGAVDEKKPSEITRSLAKGVHTVDLYLATSRFADPSFEMQCDIPEPPYFGRCPADMFDPGRHPEIVEALRFAPCEIRPNAATNAFEIVFPSNTHARTVQLALADFEGDAPAIRRIALQAADGRELLPSKDDLLGLRKNQILETLPGDRITLSYEDPTPITREKRVQEASLSATFYNAALSACFVESILDPQGNRKPFYVTMRRFRGGDPINVFIRDPDGDVSDEQDTLKFSARTTSGKPVTLDALETEVHSGVFIGKVFPVEGAPQRPAEITLAPADDVEIAYVDQNNTEYGIPWRRLFLVEQAGTNAPRMRVYDVTSALLPENEWIEKPPTNQARQASLTAAVDEFIPVRRYVTVVRPDQAYTGRAATNLVVCPVIAEVTYPAVALSPLSSVKLYIQTASARRAAGMTETNVFRPTLPGTIVFEVGPGGVQPIKPPPGYKNVIVRGDPRAAEPLDDGRFTFTIPLQLGPPASNVVEVCLVNDERRQRNWETPEYVPVHGDDEIYLGLPYQTGTNTTRWLVRTVKLEGDNLFDVMDRRYREPLEKIHIGEMVHFRAMDPAADVSDEKDERTVELQTGAGQPVKVPLAETFPHSGVFKGAVQVMFSGDVSESNKVGVVTAAYGDQVSAVYAGGTAGETFRRTFSVSKGDDGRIQSFTKRFKDPSIAVQTQFTVAEAYFEMAKKHRQMAQEELARREIAQGRKLLQEAIRDFPQSEARAQADYLLAELSLELAQDAVSEESKKQYSADALARFSDIVSSYPDSPYAPKSQFKKAMTFEKLGQIDDACEEYVKLSYKYPDNELVAETIARLGQYFLTKGKGMETEMAAATDPVKRERIRIQSAEMFKTAAQVFARLAQRFPDHQLAGKTTVLSGQCWMRAADFERAVATFKSVIESKRADGDLAAEAMYWCGDSYMKAQPANLVEAYRMFKKLTWDYPESTWAKYARGRLTEEALARVETDENS
jgi:TolA-binding protein